MTTIEQVSLVLASIDSDRAKEWLQNDIIKIKIAVSYDDWIDDIDDHGLFQTLEEHIHYCLDTPGYIDNPDS